MVFLHFTQSIASKRGQVTSRFSSMALLSTQDRFGPVLNSVASVEPHPCSYNPRLNVQASTTNRRGTFCSHHDTIKHGTRMAQRIQIQKERERQAALLHEGWNLKQESPGPHKYKPFVQGQFAQAYTVDEISTAAGQMKKRRPVTTDPGAKTERVEALRLALGPGYYEVDRDYNQERIATPFTFAQAKRSGILELVRAQRGDGSNLGPGTYYRHTEETQSSTSSRGSVDFVDTRRGGVEVSQSAFRSRSINTFLARVRSDSALGSASASKELATSYKQLQCSLQTLDKRLVRGKTRMRIGDSTGQRLRTTDASRRGPGAYERLSTEEHKSSDRDELDPAMLRSLKDAGFSEAEMLGQAVIDAMESAKRTKTGGKHSSGSSIHVSPPKSTFGRVQSRDLVESMIAAGHLNADALGPGVYKPSTDTSFNLQSGNIRHHPEYAKSRSAHKEKTIGKQEANIGSNQDTAELWRAMKAGPPFP